MLGLLQQSATNWMAYNKTDRTLSQKLKTKASLVSTCLRLSAFYFGLLWVSSFYVNSATHLRNTIPPIPSGFSPHFNKGHCHGFYLSLLVTPLLHIGRTSVLDGCPPHSQTSASS